MSDANSLVVIASPNDSLRIRWSEILEAHPQCTLRDRVAIKRFLANELSRRTSIMVCDEALIESGRDGLLTQLSRTCGNAPVLVMTTGSAELIDLEWLNCWIRGACPQTVEEDVLREAVASLLAGETWFTRRLVASRVGRATLFCPTFSVVASDRRARKACARPVIDKSRPQISSIFRSIPRTKFSFFKKLKIGFDFVQSIFLQLT
jgi:hypothetical protein